MRKITATRVSATLAVILAVMPAATLLAGACSSDGSTGDLFPIKPECAGDPVAAYAGTQPQIISKLAIGAREDGFDLDRDGDPDNKLAAVSSIAQSAIDDALNNYSIAIPMEFFDLQAAAKDTCVKFAIYLGDYVKDADADGDDPYVEGGDCNDLVAAIKKGNPEIAGNRIDDDCDKLADEDAQNVPCTTGPCLTDMDLDGQTIAQGDCDDTRNTVKMGGVEVCGDGLDNDCDGVADRTGGAIATACSPFDANNLVDVPLDPLSFVDGSPVIGFYDGVISENNGELIMDAGPSIFSVNIPVTDGISLDLRITGATIQAVVAQVGDRIVLKNGRLGGVIDAKTADTIRGLKVDQIGLLPENSLLDATFANLLGPLLALPKAKEAVTKKYPGCRTPDIDVDQDGLEAFCDTDPDNDPKVVDICIDGDGTEFTDMGDTDCTEALRKDGKYRFVDGISVELNFETSPLKAIKPPR